jgi:hypothetical protein
MKALVKGGWCHRVGTCDLFRVRSNARYATVHCSVSESWTRVRKLQVSAASSGRALPRSSRFSSGPVVCYDDRLLPAHGPEIYGPQS